MVHDLIFTVTAFLSIGAGLWAILLVNRLHNLYRFNYLNTYLYYQILLFVFGLYGLIGMAVVDELLKEMEAPESMVETIVNFLPYLGVPFLIAAWYMFIKMCMEMVGKRIKSLSTIVYFSLMMLLLLCSGFFVFSFFEVQSEEAKLISAYVKLLFICVEGLTFLVAIYFLYIHGFRIKNATTRKMVINFANINLLIKIFAIILFFFSERSTYTGAVYLLVFFSGDLPAILYLFNYLGKNYALASGSKMDKTVSGFMQDYNISKREWEIIDKICDGMTNKQISDALFISLQTVKDHTHHIYKKTGAKNRVQLVNMIGGLNNNTDTGVN